MNPLEQPNTPSTDNGLGTQTPGNEQSNPGSNTAPVQTVNSFESEDLSAAQTPEVTAIENTPVATSPSAEADPVSSVVDTSSTQQSTPTVGATSPVETPATDVATPVATPVVPSQAPQSAPATLGSDKKKPSKLVVILLVVALVIVGVATGFFVWQSM